MNNLKTQIEEKIVKKPKGGIDDEKFLHSPFVHHVNTSFASLF